MGEISGLKLVESIRAANNGIKSPDNPGRDFMLYFDPDGYRPILENTSKETKISSTHNNHTNLRWLDILPNQTTPSAFHDLFTCQRNGLYHFAKIKFENLSYKKYLECYEYLKNETCELINKRS